MPKHSFMLFVPLAVLVLVLAGCVAAPAPAAPAAEEPAAEQGTVFSTSPVGDPAVAQQEVECTAALASAEDPLYPTMARTYNNDIQHTGLFPCAQFTGSMTEPNVVVAQQSSTMYDAPFNIATLGPDGVYLYGGCGAQATPPSLVSYVAKIDPDTLDEIWRTELADASENNQAHLCGSVDAIADGSLIVTADHSLYKLDSETGEIIAQIENVPAGDAANDDVTQNGAGYFADGTIILKTWNRIGGCTLNGIFAMYGCKGTMPGTPAAPSVLSAVDPNTFEVLSSVVLDENIGSRFSTTNYQGKDYVYLTNTSAFFRYEWDGSKLTLDTSWGPAPYTERGQAGGGTPTVMGEWIIDNTNGIAQPMSIVAVSQADASKISSIQPNESMPRGTHSTSAAKPMVDAENRMAYMCDYDMATCSAIHVGDDGELSLAWKVDNMRTQSMNSLIGPADQRVLVSSSMTSTETDDPTQFNWGPDGANFTEQYQWRDAATGELLAASDFYFPKSEASQTPPGYGGVIYGLTNNGHILALHVQPAAEAVSPVHWSYEGETGPEYWGSLEPDYAACGEGLEQSPVDIPADAPVNADDVAYAYQESAVNIVNNGHAIQVNYDEGSTAEIDGTTYALQQFHFHSPSEHTPAGANMAMEMHLVHADASGNNAVIGVMLVEGAENPAFAPVWDNMPAEEGDPVTVDGAFVDVDDLLPEDLSYYHYDGSLTTPPCTERVLWHVLAQPVEISADQIATFRAIHDGTNRPVQPMNDREFLTATGD